MSFPTSPVDGQIITINNITYQWNSANSTWTRSTPATGYLSDFIYVSNITSDTGIATGSTIIFDTVVSGTGIIYNNSTGAFTLVAGKTYELFTNINWTSFSDNNGYNVYQWVDATSNTPLISNGMGAGVGIPINRNTNEINSNSVRIIYTPITNQTVKVLVTDGVGTATVRGSLGTYAQINQIGSSSLMSNVTIGGGAASTSTTTGAAIVNGGLAVQGNVNISGTLTATGGSATLPGWTNAGTIQIGATTTAPVKGTVTADNISYRQLGAKQWEIILTYTQTAVSGNAGSGDYLFTLPNSLQFDTNIPSQPIYTAIGAGNWVFASYVISSGSGMINNGSVGGQVYPVVYNSTKFRILTITYGNAVQFWGSGYYGIGGDVPKIQLTFRFTSV